MKKLFSIISLPRDDGPGEVLLAGGMEGVFEYKLTNSSALK
jgi:hypothetical protein